MSKNLFQIPINTPLINPQLNALDTTWNRYFKAIGDDMLKANKSENLQIKTIVDNKVEPVNGPITYTINGCIVFGVYNNPNKLVSETILLPATPVAPFQFGSEVISIGTKSITVDTSISFVQFWYFVN